MIRFAVLLVLLLPALTRAQDAGHAFTSFDPADLAWVKERVEAKDPRQVPAYARLVKQADQALARPATSVLDKKTPAASGNPHDFHSIGSYSWPNPGSANRLPYVRRDGQRNPEAASDAYDKGRFNRMVNDVNTLALADYFSGDARYGRKAVQLLRAWFVAPPTRMNPSLRYAAAQPGVSDGDHGGIIEGVVLVEMLDYVELLRRQGRLGGEDLPGLQAWFGDYATWLLEGEFGKAEARSGNNHGSWYVAQVMASALFAGQRGRAEAQLPEVRRHLTWQFAGDGSMPREMARSNAAMYSVYGLRSIVALARLSDGLGFDAWHYRHNGAAPMERAFLYLAPYASGTAKWTGNRIDSGYDHYTAQIFRLAGAEYGGGTFDAAVAHLVEHAGPTDRYARLLGRPGVEAHATSARAATD